MRCWSRAGRGALCEGEVLSGERERRLAAERKRAHREFANRILAEGRRSRPQLSCRAFRCCSGRSAKVRGAGKFIAELKRKAKACGEVIEFSLARTDLSQSRLHDDGRLREDAQLACARSWRSAERSAQRRLRASW